MSTTRVHVLCTWAPQWQITRLWIWEQQFRRTRTRQRPTWWCTHYQGLILSQQLKMLVNSWHSRPLKQPTQKSCPSLVTFNPILMKYAAQKYGGEKTACKGAISMFSLFDCTMFCACEAGSSCLNQLTKRSWRRWGRSLLINKAFEYNRNP